MTPLKAIRKFCLECVGNSVKEVAECCCFHCSLYHFRYGTNPRRKGVARVENLKKIPTQ